MGGQMSDAKRFLLDGTGLTYEEIVDFPSECIRTEKGNKRTILSGYFDLLYYEHRQQLAIRYAAMSAILVVVAVLFVVLHEHALATAIVVALVGIANAILSHRQNARFSNYLNTLERELRRLAVCFPHQRPTR